MRRLVIVGNGMAATRLVEELVDTRSDDELEPRTAGSDRLAVPRGAKARPEVERPAGRVCLLDEEDDPLGAAVPRPRRNGADQRAGDAAPARRRVDPQRDELHLERIEAAEPPDHTEQSSVVLGEEQHLVDALGSLRRAGPPYLLGLADDVLVARREVRCLFAQHAQASLAPALPLVGPDGADLHPARLDD